MKKTITKPTVKKKTPAQVAKEKAKKIKEKEDYKNWQKKYNAEKEKERARKLKAAQNMELPKPLKATDIIEPKSYKSRISFTISEYNRVSNLDLWQTDNGEWVIPCLLISKARSNSGVENRNYAISLGGKMYRVGLGPHIKKTIKVYFTKSNQKRMQPLFDLYLKGMEKANITRDRISSKRMRRSMFGL